MSETSDHIVLLVQAGSVRISEHGYDELAADDILVRDIVEGVMKAKIVEDYPEFPKGLACSCSSRMGTERRYTPCGVFLRVIRSRQSWSRPTDLTLAVGKMGS
jgi:hypothetical protein